MMQTGRGGMGLSKHRKAGHPNRGGRFKMAVENEANQPRKTPRKPRMFSTVREAFAAALNEMKPANPAKD